MRINDGLIHLHYPQDRRDEEIYAGFEKLKWIKDQYKIEKAVCIFVPSNKKVAEKIIEENNFVYPSLYVNIESYSKKLLEDNLDVYKAVKLHHWLLSPTSMPEYVEPIIKDALEVGFKKFQIHSESISKEFFDDVIKKYAKGDNVIYLAHGIDALYSSKFLKEKTPAVKELKELSNNLLLGTSRHSKGFPVPDPYLMQAKKDGFEDMMVFESDWVPYDSESWYPGVIDGIRESVGPSDKIFYKNLKKFFE